MKPAAAEKLLKDRGFHGRTASAVYLVLTSSMTQAEAAKTAGVGAAAVSRMMAKLTTTTTCKCCGQSIRRIK